MDQGIVVLIYISSKSIQNEPLPSLFPSPFRSHYASSLQPTRSETALFDSQHGNLEAIFDVDI